MRAMLGCAMLAAVLSSGCATTGGGKDPYESANRAVFAFNEAFDESILRPVAQGYVDLVPVIVRQGVTNFFGNIEDLFSAVNGILQWKPEKAGEDIGRVLTNTAFGFLGIIDIAGGAGIEKGEEDFGQTFAVWGMPAGPYMVLPFFGSSSGRDALALALRIPLDPFVEVGSPAVTWSRIGLGFVNARAQLLGTEKLVERAALDKYVYLREAYLQRRRNLIYDGRPPAEAE